MGGVLCAPWRKLLRKPYRLCNAKSSHAERTGWVGIIRVRAVFGESIMTSTTINRSGTNQGFTLRFVPEFLGRIASGVVNYVQRARAESQLEALDDRLLADIGVSRSEIRTLVWCGKKN
jgi:uncharacterized protein YjiS (DUF1127 family)